MLLINFICIFYLLVLVTCRTISKSATRLPLKGVFDEFDLQHTGLYAPENLASNRPNYLKDDETSTLKQVKNLKNVPTKKSSTTSTTKNWRHRYVKLPRWKTNRFYHAKPDSRSIRRAMHFRSHYTRPWVVTDPFNYYLSTPALESKLEDIKYQTATQLPISPATSSIFSLISQPSIMLVQNDLTTVRPRDIVNRENEFTNLNTKATTTNELDELSNLEDTGIDEPGKNKRQNTNEDSEQTEQIGSQVQKEVKKIFSCVKSKFSFPGASLTKNAKYKKEKVKEHKKGIKCEKCKKTSIKCKEGSKKLKHAKCCSLKKKKQELENEISEVSKAAGTKKSGKTPVAVKPLKNMKASNKSHTRVNSMHTSNHERRKIIHHNTSIDHPNAARRERTVHNNDIESPENKKGWSTERELDSKNSGATNYEALSNKLSYKDFVDGFKYYLNFEKDMAKSNFSDVVRYEAHKHHNVDDIGKFILEKIPRVPIGEYYRTKPNGNAIVYRSAHNKPTKVSWWQKFFHHKPKNVNCTTKRSGYDNKPFTRMVRDPAPSEETEQAIDTEDLDKLTAQLKLWNISESTSDTTETMESDSVIQNNLDQDYVSPDHYYTPSWLNPNTEKSRARRHFGTVQPRNEFTYGIQPPSTKNDKIGVQEESKNMGFATVTLVQAPKEKHRSWYGIFRSRRKSRASRSARHNVLKKIKEFFINTNLTTKNASTGGYCYQTSNYDVLKVHYPSTKAPDYQHNDLGLYLDSKLTHSTTLSIATETERNVNTMVSNKDTAETEAEKRETTKYTAEWKTTPANTPVMKESSSDAFDLQETTTTVNMLKMNFNLQKELHKLQQVHAYAASKIYDLLNKDTAEKKKEKHKYAAEGKATPALPANLLLYSLDYLWKKAFKYPALNETDIMYEKTLDSGQPLTITHQNPEDNVWKKAFKYLIPTETDILNDKTDTDQHLSITHQEPEVTPSGTVRSTRLARRNTRSTGIEQRTSRKQVSPTVIWDPEVADKKAQIGKRETDKMHMVKNVAAIEVVIDTTKSDEGYETPIKSAIPNSQENKNALQVHIAFPKNENMKRSPGRTKKIFTAQMISPVDLLYQIYPNDEALETTTTRSSRVLPPGMYLLVENCNTTIPEGNLIVRRLPNNINLSNIVQRDVRNISIESNDKDIYDTTPKDTLSKVTLSKDFISAVNQDLVQLYEAFAKINSKINESPHSNQISEVTLATHLVNDSYQNSSKFKDSGLELNKITNVKREKAALSLNTVKEYVSDGKDEEFNNRRKRLCHTDPFSDAAAAELIAEMNNLVKYMNEHCTEIQTFFHMNPSGGRKLRDTVRRVDKLLDNYFKKAKRDRLYRKPCLYDQKVINKRDMAGFIEIPTDYTTRNPIDNLEHRVSDMNNRAKLGISVTYKLQDRDNNLVGVLGKYALSDRKEDILNSVKKIDNLLNNAYTLDKVNVKIIYNSEPIPTTILKSEKVTRGSRKREIGSIDSPLNTDAGGSFWSKYIYKTNRGSEFRKTNNSLEMNVTENREASHLNQTTQVSTTVATGTKANIYFNESLSKKNNNTILPGFRTKINELLRINKIKPYTLLTTEAFKTVAFASTETTPDAKFESHSTQTDTANLKKKKMYKPKHEDNHKHFGKKSKSKSKARSANTIENTMITGDSNDNVYKWNTTTGNEYLPPTQATYYATKPILCEVNHKTLKQVNYNTSIQHKLQTRSDDRRKRGIWKSVKKYLYGTRTCNCKCKANETMCKICLASHLVMEEVIARVNNIVKYIHCHDKEIGEYFQVNPTGAAKLRIALKSVDKCLKNYYKRVRGQCRCRGKPCEAF